MHVYLIDYVLALFSKLGMKSEFQGPIPIFGLKMERGTEQKACTSVEEVLDGADDETWGSEDWPMAVDVLACAGPGR
jgi:hypothetical protein